ncbi:MAG TPA: hypothetical protein VHZ75_05780 [Solirubrobacteraceae bacterium]|jgi:plastocyanin|nr:hypothetical protein [Solirubrobacteraceae bacterium]
MTARRAPRALLLGATLTVALGAAFASPPATRPAAADDGSIAMGTMTAALERVSIGFDAVQPKTIDVITGDSVTWTNESARVHTVTADDGAFDSGRLSMSDTFTRRFTSPGVVAYHCTLHPSIQGVVVVHDLLLDAPAQAATPNHPFPISGRAALPAGTAVSIEADSGAGFAPAGTATVGADGGFSTEIDPTATATYRAVAGTVTSDPVQLLVLDRSISLSLRRRDGRVHLRADVAPATRDGRIVLQLYLPERFGWWPVRTAKLDRGSGASFTLRTKRPVKARVRYTLPDGATALATSRTVQLAPPRAKRGG